jgi:deoxycytidylate deaminase
VYYEAREKALSNGRVYHLAAILRRRGKVVRIGVNTDKTHPKFTRQYPDGTSRSNMHAEMNVLRFAKPGDTLEVLRCRKSDEGFAIAKPCKWCVEHIRDAGISEVRYTNRSGAWEEMNV